MSLFNFVCALVRKHNAKRDSSGGRFAADVGTLIHGVFGLAKPAEVLAVLLSSLGLLAGIRIEVPGTGSQEKKLLQVGSQIGVVNAGSRPRRLGGRASWDRAMERTGRSESKAVNARWT